MGISSAVHWWEEWQLRILVLGSLFVQYLLFFSAPFRKRTIPSWFRSIIWLSYLGSDALAKYALATLFSRQRKQDYHTVHGNSILEVVWAPVLLMHLGGQDCITAYNIEDNDLWGRHVLTAVSQITVAVYVFCRSWPGGDKRLLQVVFLLFTPGILKCVEKPWALRRASFNSLVSLSHASRSRKANRRDETISLETYVQMARSLFCADYVFQKYDVAGLGLNHVPQAKEEPNEVDLEGNHVRESQEEPNEVDLEGNHVREAQGENDINLKKHRRLELEARKLFADLASSYPDRLVVLFSFLGFCDDQKVTNICARKKEAYDSLQKGLSDTFDRLYTKWKFAVMFRDPDMVTATDTETSKLKLRSVIPAYVRLAAMYLPFAAIGLFHESHKEAYNVHDVKVTYALLCCTATLELFSSLKMFQLRLSGAVAQYSLVGFFASNKKHTKKKCASSFEITMLVLGHVKGWWMEHITDVASYWRFNDHRGQWTIQHKGCYQDLEWSINMPFDESVLLWHIATDLCFYQKGDTSVSHAKATGCREISNYMIYLLFVNPEMLLSGTRPHLFMEANAELEKILKGDKPVELRKGEWPSSEEIERGYMQRIISKLRPSTQEGFIQDACKISEVLLALGDEKMWEVIEGVWVEMLCFSASRCRGYLHAKSMGSGMELLTYVWFLLSRMGMETLPERLQRTELSSGAANGGATPSASQIHEMENPTRFRRSRSQP